MDAQGFECRILDGMKKVLAATETVRTEAGPRLLQMQGCSTGGMLDRLKTSGFAIDPMEKEGPQDVFARRSSPPPPVLLEKLRTSKEQESVRGALRSGQLTMNVNRFL
mmetsp:Transcript_20173/g.44039  ORF Transcript_20173/g.44039 Transcript_20173/m.44039 type:complete len:108 (+) Transcript_20173:609-932(+)